MLLAFALALVVTLAFSVKGIYINDSSGVIAPCDSPLYCQGPILQAIELARPFSDSKTYVDLPTIRPLDEVLAAFANLSTPLTNGTELQTFLSTYFGQPGGEIVPLPQEQLVTNASFLDKIDDDIVHSFLSQVIDVWPTLTREYVGAGATANCSGCVSSFIPVNRTFVVAGGRFREPYYWDSYFIIEGLLRTQGTFTSIARNMIENFLDFVEKYGFVPNGARIYYLNRSQPPLLTLMVKTYVEYTNDTSLLDRALPLLEKELRFWATNNTVEITSPWSGNKYNLSRYAVLNNQPRPESFREDYITATNTTYFSLNGSQYPVGALNDSAKAALYAELASGAESGIDYSTRWLRNPLDAVLDTGIPLRSLALRETIPVDLNSVLYATEIAIANFHLDKGNRTAYKHYQSLANQRVNGMYDLMFNETEFRYFDYNMSSKAHNVIGWTGNATHLTQGVRFYPQQFWPFWLGAVPETLATPEAVQVVYQPISELLDLHAGAIGASNLQSGQQWDAPNVWPPLLYALMQGLLKHTTASASSNTTTTADQQNYNLASELAQRYLDSAFCTWRSTGGAIPNVLPDLPNSSPDANGTIFEKYADNSTDVAGGGGEYAVVPGFGWSNGVLIWSGDVFSHELRAPDCGDIKAANVTVEGKLKRRWSLEVEERDAFIRMWRG